jgi:hypothetical protein
MSHTSPFEIVMLLCFGAAWPFSIYRSIRSRSVEGKSLFFLIVVCIGYVSGVLHKVLYRYDYVVYLYALNGCMVLADIILYLRNRRFAARGGRADA